MRLTCVSDSNRPILRLITAALGGFCFVTIAEVIWGFLTPGDYFANGSPLLLPSVIASLTLGLYLGIKASGRLRVAIFVLSVACMCYWVFVPVGWWVKPLRGHALRAAATVTSK